MFFHFFQTCSFWIVSTDIYHAQYRVLEAFSLFNVILSECQLISILNFYSSFRHSLGIPSLLACDGCETPLPREPQRVVHLRHVISMVWI